MNFAVMIYFIAWKRNMRLSYCMNSFINVYPNPLNDNLHIHLNEVYNHEISITVFNALGQEMDAIIIKPFETDLTISTREWMPGLCIAMITARDFISTIKLIKQ